MQFESNDVIFMCNVQVHNIDDHYLFITGWRPFTSFLAVTVPPARVQWTLDYTDLDYPDPRLSGSRTEIIARAYNDLRMRVVAVDEKKIVYMAAKSQLKIVRLLDKAVYHSAPLVARQQLALLALFTATGRRIWPIISLIRIFHLSGMVFILLWPKGSGSRVHCSRE